MTNLSVKFICNRRMRDILHQERNRFSIIFTLTLYAPHISYVIASGKYGGYVIAK